MPKPIVAMLGEPADEVAGDCDVERAQMLAGRDIDARLAIILHEALCCDFGSLHERQLMLIWLHAPPDRPMGAGSSPTIVRDFLLVGQCTADKSAGFCQYRVV
jgi:hypothetical protein